MKRIAREQLVNLQNKYHSDRAIASFYGVSRQAIYKLRKRYNIPAWEPNRTPRNRRIRALYEQGVRADRIADRFNLSVSSVYRILSGERSKGRPYSSVREYCEESQEAVPLLCSEFLHFSARNLNRIPPLKTGEKMDGLFLSDQALRREGVGSFETAESLRLSFARSLSFIGRIVYLRDSAELKLIRNRIYLLSSPVTETIFNNKSEADTSQQFTQIIYNEV